MRILIHGGGLQGLSCGESLHKLHEVDILTEDLTCLRSNFFKIKYNHSVADERYFEKIDITRYDVIIPVSDICVSFHSRKQDYIERQYGVKIAVPNQRCVSIVEDKQLFISFCEKHDLPHPNTISLGDGNLHDAFAFIGSPALIKPNFSVGARGITLINSLEELKEKYPPIYSQFGNCTLQELIANREYYYNVMIYRDAKGDILASTIIKIVRMYPVNAGSSTCCITVDNPALISLCIKALEAMNWVGMADFDVLQRLDNEEYKIIEINPRVPASLRAAYISGVNFPEIIAREAVGLSPKEYHYEPGKILRYLGTDLLWAIKKRKLWGNHPSWWTFISKSTFYQDIYIQDSSTWFTWFISGISKLWNRNKRLR